MFKRSQKQVNDASKHWYQDKYQHVLVQRNIFAALAVFAVVVSGAAVFTVAHLSPLKSVDPYLLMIDEKTGITQKVEPVSRNEYAANQAVDRFFVSNYIRARESYNFSILRYNYNLVRVMSTTNVYGNFRKSVDTSSDESLGALLGPQGTRDVRIRSISYIQNPVPAGQAAPVTPVKIMQARIATVDSKPGAQDIVQYWVITITFQYASIDLNEEEQLLNPLGFTVSSYQIQKELSYQKDQS